MANEKILVIDDERLIVELMEDILKKEGYIVKGFTDGEDALKCVLEEKFDLVLVDLKMPKIDGIEVLKKIKEVSPQTEVIIVTAYATIDTAVESIKLGAYDYITKPFDIDNLLQKLKRCLEKKSLVEEVDTLKDVISIYKVTRALSSCIGLKELFDLMLKLLCEVLNADSSSILLLDENTKTLKIEAYYNLKLQDAEKIRIKVGERIAGWVAQNGNTLLLIDGIDKDPRFRHLEPRPEIKCAMVAPLKIEDKIIGVLTLNSLRDTRHFTEREQKLFTIFADNAALAVRDARAYNKLKELDGLKSEFISNVSHELRTPLTAISGSIDLILNTFSDEISDGVKRLLNITKNNSDRLVKLVNEILDFSKIEAGVLIISKGEIDISFLVRQTIEELRTLADEKKLSLNSEVPNEPIYVMADSNRIKQVIVNLIGNSLKFTKEGGITVGVRLLEKEVVVFVKDTGIGIPEESKNKIFERFYRVDCSLKKETSGFGIGLSLCKSIVEAHNGKIWFESKLGEGSTFYFSLPIEKSKK